MAVYLDNNATTALHEQVLEAMLPYMGAVCGNPSSVHRFGRLQRDGIEQAREQVARLVGARAEQVTFTSGGTESNNLLVRGIKQVEGGCRRIAVSAIEHMSMLEPCQQLFVENEGAESEGAESTGAQMDVIAVDNNGLVTDSALRQALKTDTGLVSVMMANNETGVVQNLSPLVKRCRQQAIWFHTDASQAAGKIVLNFNESGLHAMTLSAHKLYGPIGAGALILDKALPIKAIQFGGAQEKNLRAGTENVAAIVGFGKAAELAVENLEQRQQHCRKLRDYLEQGLKQFSAVSIFAEHAQRLPNTVQFGVAGFDGESLLMQLDRKAIAVSSGSACTSGKTQPSHVLKAMNVPTDIALSAVRVSFGENNTASDVDALIKALQSIVEASNHSSVMMAASL